MELSAVEGYTTPLSHARESGDEVVDGLRGGLDLDTGFAMHTMDSHERSPRGKEAHGLRRPERLSAIITPVRTVVQGQGVAAVPGATCLPSASAFDVRRLGVRVRHRCGFGDASMAPQAATGPGSHRTGRHDMPDVPTSTGVRHWQGLPLAASHCVCHTTVLHAPARTR